MSKRLVAVFTPFEDLTDPRIERTRVHDLIELVVVALCGTIAGADSWADIERFGNDRLSWLRTFLRLEGGIPSHDTFGRVFALINPDAFERCFMAWVQSLIELTGEHALHIDGKTLRHSFDAASAKAAIHMITVWSSKAQLALGQRAVDDKSNAITAIPKLLDLITLYGAVVAIDATPGGGLPDGHREQDRQWRRRLHSGGQR